MNFNKSSISFSLNVTEDVKALICDTLEVNATTNHGTYLGLPSLVGRNKKEVFLSTRDRVWQKLQSWSMRMLSRAGKEILLKIVVQAIPNYAMQVYLLPLNLCRELETMMNSFWWGNNRNGGGGIRWMRWKFLCEPKTYGGIGFKILHDFNMAMLRKQVWKLLLNLKSLVGQIFRPRYFSNTSIAEVGLGYNPSFVWRSLMAAKHVVVCDSRIHIGSDHNCSIGSAPWLPDADNDFISTSLPEQISTS